MGHTPLLSQMHKKGAGLTVEQLGLESVPIWDHGVAFSGLTCCATVLAPLSVFKKLSLLLGLWFTLRLNAYSIIKSFSLSSTLVKRFSGLGDFVLHCLFPLSAQRLSQ